jgi:hypothetical protein
MPQRRQYTEMLTINLAAACPCIIKMGILDAQTPQTNSPRVRGNRKLVVMDAATTLRNSTWMPQRCQYSEMGAINSAAACS